MIDITPNCTQTTDYTTTGGAPRGVSFGSSLSPVLAIQLAGFHSSATLYRCGSGLSHLSSSPSVRRDGAGFSMRE
jgi:hypothetical protein